MGDFAVNVGIDNASKGKNIVDRHTFGILFGLAGRDHDGSVLAARISILGNSDGKFYFTNLVWFDGAGGFENGDPFGNLGISRNSGDIGLIIFTDNIIG